MLQVVYQVHFWLRHLRIVYLLQEICLQKYICVFSISSFFQVSEIIFIIDTPDFWAVQKNRKRKRIEKFISDTEG